MKKVTIIESAIIGFLVGALVAAYMVFLIGTRGYIGSVLSWLSLQPLASVVSISESNLIGLYVFFVGVYVVYGALLGAIMRTGRKKTVMGFLLIVGLFVCVFLQQKGGVSTWAGIQDDSYLSIPASPISHMNSNSDRQYFGNEVIGDLNGDEKNDVAFLLIRDDDAERGRLYYLAAALSTNGGHSGTNVIFLGNGVAPYRMSIQKGIIEVDSFDKTAKTSSSTKVMYMEVLDGELKEVSVSAVSGTAGDTPTRTQ